MKLLARSRCCKTPAPCFGMDSFQTVVFGRPGPAHLSKDYCAVYCWKGQAALLTLNGQSHRGDFGQLKSGICSLGFCMNYCNVNEK